MKIVEADKRIDFKQILYLTDFSGPSREALPVAAAIARTYGSRIVAAHVLVPSSYDYMAPEATINLLESQQEWAHAEMERVETSLYSVPRVTFIEQGSTLWEVVSRLVKVHDIDLIVLGTHGRTGLKKALLGSSAEEVFRHSRVPVLTNGPAARESTKDFARFHCILFATDFNEASSAAASYAVSLAEENQAQLVLLHVLPQPKPGKTSKPGELSVAEAIHRLESFVPQEAEFWCRPRAVVGHGDTADQVLSAARKHEADLIVLGVQGMHGLTRVAARVQKDIAYEIVAHAPCPVLTIRGES
ncbi:MAG TPA: universal stress protein [Candidatus Solibacter sp.]|nr:universal stress protein [Candidatus Solibacter sp.]